MGKKAFALDQVLNYRSEVEKVCRLEFASAKQRFEGACARLEDDENSVSLLDSEFLDRQWAGMPATELQMYSDFFQRKKNDLMQQRQQVDLLNSKMTEQREVLIDAARDKKVLENLKDKKVKAHARELLDKERIFLEELSLQKRGAR
ncbi:MAG: flagellar export protein FliJ [Deltaproteobacteria bacterium]|nr:flagellar export protein FliJ [Deltaproteobacteria bacterium]